MRPMKEKPKKKRGGQPKDNPANARFEVRTTADKLEAYKNKAEKEGKSFSDWVRDALDRALKRK